MLLHKRPSQSFKRCSSALCPVPSSSTHKAFGHQCHSSLYSSHPYSSFLALQLPGSMLPIAACHGNGYAYCRFPYAFLGRHRYLIRWRCVQTFNSLGQNACTVAAFMMSTCSGGCETCIVLHLRALSYHLFRSVHYQCASRSELLVLGAQRF